MRDKILRLSIGTILNDMKDGMELANKCGDTASEDSFKSKVNSLEEIINSLISAYESDPELLDAVLESEN